MENKKLDKWVDLAEKNPIPVLKHTIKELRLLCQREDIPIKEITHVVERDPGLVIHILRDSNSRPKKGLAAEITHINQAFRLMGTDQLTRLPHVLPAAGDVLNQASKIRLFSTFSRAYHAARFATDWAALRRDMTPDEVFAAAQLHFLGEMVIAVHEPALLDKITELRTQDHIAAEEAQFIVLGFTFNELTKKIAVRLKFPELVHEALSAENARHPRAYGIMLGVQLARSVTFEGWYSENTFKLQKEIAEWMDISIDAVIARSHTIAAEIAREIPQYDTVPAAYHLIANIAEITESKKKEKQESPHDAAVCLIPQLPVLRESMKMFARFPDEPVEADDFISEVVNVIHDGIGLNRVVFCRYNEESNLLEGHIFKGSENDPVFNRFNIKMDNNNLFARLIAKPQAVLINDESRKKLWPIVATDFQKLISTNSFVAISVFIKNKPYGMFYADRHTAACQVENKSYNYFKSICREANKILETIME